MKGYAVYVEANFINSENQPEPLHQLIGYFETKDEAENFMENYKFAVNDRHLYLVQAKLRREPILSPQFNHEYYDSPLDS